MGDGYAELLAGKEWGIEGNNQVEETMIQFEFNNFEEWKDRENGIGAFMIKVIESITPDTEFPVRITVEYGEDLED